MKEIDINLARYEMNNYRSNIIPVAQFFDQQGHLHIVSAYQLDSRCLLYGAITVIVKYIAK